MRNLYTNALTEPLTLRELKEMSEKGDVTGIVSVELNDIVQHDEDWFLDTISEKLTGCTMLRGILHNIVGHIRNILYIEVSGDVADILEGGYLEEN